MGNTNLTIISFHDMDLVRGRSFFGAGWLKTPQRQMNMHFPHFFDGNVFTYARAPSSLYTYIPMMMLDQFLDEVHRRLTMYYVG